MHTRNVDKRPAKKLVPTSRRKAEAARIPPKKAVDLDQLEREIDPKAKDEFELIFGSDFQPRATTWDQLRGRRAISYFRFSSINQGKGSTIERQQYVLNQVLSYTGLILDAKYIDVFIDRGKSASKGHQLTRGKLGKFLELLGLNPDGSPKFLADGTRAPCQIERGTVLIIEGIDRLVREPMSKAYRIICAIIEAGIIIVAGTTLRIWDEVSIDSSQNHELTAAINAAHEEAKNLGHRQRGAQARRRRNIHAFCTGKTDIVPVLNHPPGWLRRSADPTIGYEEIPGRVLTIQKMFDLCLQGLSLKDIAVALNKDIDLYPVFGSRRSPTTGETQLLWGQYRIGQILRDEHVLGRIVAARGDDTIARLENQRKGLAFRGKVLPQIIDDATWTRVRAEMKARTHAQGPKGVHVANLFNGKMKCGKCNKPVRTRCGMSGNRPNSHDPVARLQATRLVCTRAYETGKCDDTGYALYHYEPLILQALIAISNLVPRGKNNATAALTAERATLLVEMEQKRKTREMMLRRKSVSEENVDLIMKMGVQIDNARRRADQLDRLINEAAAPVSRSKEVWAFIRQYVQKAVNGDVATRERLRNLLAPIQFEIICNIPQGGVMVIANGHEEHIDAMPSDDGQNTPCTVRIPLDRSGPAIGVVRKINGAMYRHSGMGWWVSVKDGTGIRIKTGKAKQPDIGTVKVHNGSKVRYCGQGWWTYLTRQPLSVDTQPEA